MYAALYNPQPWNRKSRKLCYSKYLDQEHWDGAGDIVDGSQQLESLNCQFLPDFVVESRRLCLERWAVSAGYINVDGSVKYRQPDNL
jgi:hypothetical protein